MLSAFLLDGSSDLALAAAAEEAAREAVRLTAKNIFKDRKNGNNSGGGDDKGGERCVLRIRIVYIYIYNALVYCVVRFFDIVYPAISWYYNLIFYLLLFTLSFHFISFHFIFP